jgi:outer membrane protein OmpA-like peptidoglycan-associated protein
MKNRSFFWASYSDLMTSLFFIMLVLFILTTFMLKKQIDAVEKTREATETQMRKIKEIENAINQIDTTYFEYNETHKKHILKIDVSFGTGSSDIHDIPSETRDGLKKAGLSISRFIDEANSRYHGVKYLMVVEGQDSKDGYLFNDELSYKRALSLVRYWEEENVKFDKEKCELIVAGSGTSGALREQPDVAGNTKNQRFLIHIIPKPGIVNQLKP